MCPCIRVYNAHFESVSVASTSCDIISMTAQAFLRSTNDDIVSRCVLFRNQFLGLQKWCMMTSRSIRTICGFTTWLVFLSSPRHGRIRCSCFPSLAARVISGGASTMQTCLSCFTDNERVIQSQETLTSLWCLTPSGVLVRIGDCCCDANGRRKRSSHVHHFIPHVDSHPAAVPLGASCGTHVGLDNAGVDIRQNISGLVASNNIFQGMGIPACVLAFYTTRSSVACAPEIEVHASFYSSSRLDMDAMAEMARLSCRKTFHCIELVTGTRRSTVGINMSQHI